MGYYVKVKSGINIYVEDPNPMGKSTILFIHGWPLNHKMFEYQFDQLIKMGYRCIGLDLRGFGNSDKPAGGYSYDQLADDIRGVVDVLQLQNFTLAGHSVGGAISTRYMARHKGYGVSKLVLIGAAAPSFTKRPDFPYGFTKEEVNIDIEETYKDRPKMLQGIGDLFFFQYVSEPFASWFFQLGLQAAGWSTAEVLVSLRDENVFADLEKIEVSTLICHGIHDKICPFQFAEAQKQRIKNSRLVPFEDSGHGLVMEQSDKFNKELTQFIEE